MSVYIVQLRVCAVVWQYVPAANESATVVLYLATIFSLPEVHDEFPGYLDAPRQVLDFLPVS